MYIMYIMYNVYNIYSYICVCKRLYSNILFATINLIGLFCIKHIESMRAGGKKEINTSNCSIRSEIILIR